MGDTVALIAHQQRVTHLVVVRVAFERRSAREIHVRHATQIVALELAHHVRTRAINRGFVTLPIVSMRNNPEQWVSRRPHIVHGRVSQLRRIPLPVGYLVRVSDTVDLAEFAGVRVVGSLGFCDRGNALFLVVHVVRHDP